MKALAAVNIRQYEEAAAALFEYERTVEMGFQVVLRSGPVRRWSSLRDDREGRGVVVFGSDQGMCGQFNDRIAEYAEDKHSRAGAEKDVRAVAVGTRVAGRLENLGWGLDTVFDVPGSVSAISASSDRLLLHIEKWREERPMGTVLLYHNRHRGGAAYEPTRRYLLPVDFRMLERLASADWPSRSLPMHTMDWEDLFADLVRQYFFVVLYRAFAESAAAENASRLASMQSAEKNVRERLEDLNRRYHRERQTAITSELLDIVAGFEALAKGR
jgi:F-type H+-transporting ATPase subunit gamma